MTTEQFKIKENPLRAGLVYQEKKTIDGGYYLEIKYRGGVAASCRLNPSGSGKWNYVLDPLKVRDEYQRNNPQNPYPSERYGFGSEIIEYANQTLIREKKSAYVINSITEPRARNLYADHGWKSAWPGSGNAVLYFDGAKVQGDKF